MAAQLLLLFLSQLPLVEGTPFQQLAMSYIEIKPGSGPAAEPGQEYTVHYTGWLRDGTKFDSSVDRNEPFKFVQGRRLVIAGWEAGFEGMRAGGKRRLFVPYQMAYGEKGRGPIPAKAELIFDIELLGVRNVPEMVPGAELINPLKEIEKKILGLADAIPDDKYSYRPQPGTRSVSELFIHISNGNELLLAIAKGLSGAFLEKQITANEALEKAPTTKAAIRARLVASFAAVRRELEEARTGTLAREMAFFGSQTSQRGIFTFLDTHVAEHLGQAITYARLCGVHPPWSSAP